MKRFLAVSLVCACVIFAVSSRAQDVPNNVQQSLIALDKQWGEAAGDSAKLDKIVSNDLVAIGAKGEAQNKQQLIAANKDTSAGVTNNSYVADQYKFEMLSPDVVVMSHRATSKGMKDGKEVTDSHRSLHVFHKQNGQWQVAANAQLPVTD
jgi:hypothetical protein